MVQSKQYYVLQNFILLSYLRIFEGLSNGLLFIRRTFDYVLDLKNVRMLHSVTGNPFFAKGIFAFDTLLFGSFFKIEEKYVEREKQPHKWGKYIYSRRKFLI